MSESTGPSNPVERVVEKVTGTAKEAAGTITGKEELRREGEEQEQAAMRDHRGGGARPAEDEATSQPQEAGAWSKAPGASIGRE
ncbi:MAG: CsbD family protein, partial [Actinomycetota bacterium]|nr:CsbD family protein [Actinomycetota bacterium]